MANIQEQFEELRMEKSILIIKNRFKIVNLIQKSNHRFRLVVKLIANES